VFKSRKFFEWGGIAASIILVAFGIASIIVGINGRSTVRDSLKQEAIVGTADMTPTAIKAEAKQAGLNIAAITFPTQGVANKQIDTGAKARIFAEYMRIHALEATHGYAYAQMGRFLAKDGTPSSQLAKGGGTDNPKFAVIDPKTTQPVANGVRDVWVTETALTTALNTSYRAERLAAEGVAELCPRELCAFWEPGGAVLPGSCMIERLGIDTRRDDLATYLLEVRERLEQARRLS
jgi:hypothetical protein